MSEFDHLLLLLAGGDDDEYDRLAGGLHGDHPIFEAAYTRIQQLDAELAGEESRVYELQGELAAAQAEARQQRGRADSLEAEVYELQEELARVREVADGMREHADSCGHYSERSKANAVGYWHARLVDALSQPAEYRLLTRADKIEATDELLRDDCVTWAPVAGDLCKGMQYNPDFFVPVRRRVGAAPAAQEGRDDA